MLETQLIQQGTRRQQLQSEGSFQTHEKLIVESSCTEKPENAIAVRQMPMPWRIGVSRG